MSATRCFHRDARTGRYLLTDLTASDAAALDVEQRTRLASLFEFSPAVGCLVSMGTTITYLDAALGLGLADGGEIGTAPTLAAQLAVLDASREVAR